MPPGIAQGFLTLEDDTQLLYLISEPHEPTAERGVRWDDPMFAVEWPMRPLVISDRDASFPDAATSGLLDEVDR